MHQYKMTFVDRNWDERYLTLALGRDVVGRLHYPSAWGEREAMTESSFISRNIEDGFVYRGTSKVVGCVYNGYFYGSLTKEFNQVLQIEGQDIMHKVAC